MLLSAVISNHVFVQPSATTDRPTSSPTQSPTTRSPTGSPTFRPTQAPTAKPTLTPTNQPTSRPSTDRPTSKPTNQPSIAPTTAAPTTRSPTNQPTRKPTNSPVLPNDSPVLSCPLPGSTMIVITSGVKQVTPAAATPSVVYSSAKNPNLAISSRSLGRITVKTGSPLLVYSPAPPRTSMPRQLFCPNSKMQMTGTSSSQRTASCPNGSRSPSSWK